MANTANLGNQQSGGPLQDGALYDVPAGSLTTTGTLRQHQHSIELSPLDTAMSFVPGSMGYGVVGGVAGDLATAAATQAQRRSFATNFAYSEMYKDTVLESLMAYVITPRFAAQMSLAGMPTKRGKIPMELKHTAGDLTEGEQMLNTVLLTDSVEIDTSEVGIMATVTDVLEESDLPSASMSRARQIGKAMADKLDIDMCEVIDDFDETIAANTFSRTIPAQADRRIGTSSGKMTTALFLDAIAKLEARDACGLGPLVGVFHPEQIDDLRRNILDSDSSTTALMRFTPGETGTFGKANMGYFGSWFDIDCFMSTNVQNHSGVWKGGIFASNYAIWQATKWAVRAHMMYWPPLRAHIMLSTSMYGFETIRHEAGLTAQSVND